MELPAADSRIRSLREPDFSLACLPPYAAIYFLPPHISRTSPASEIVKPAPTAAAGSSHSHDVLLGS